VRLDLESPALAAAAFDTMMDSYRHMRGYTAEQLDRTREDLVSIVRYSAAARLVADPSVFTDFLDWLRDLLAARDVPLVALAAGLHALAPGVDAFDGDAGELIRHGLRHLADEPRAAYEPRTVPGEKVSIG